MQWQANAASLLVHAGCLELGTINIANLQAPASSMTQNCAGRRNWPDKCTCIELNCQLQGKIEPVGDTVVKSATSAASPYAARRFAAKRDVFCNAGSPNAAFREVFCEPSSQNIAFREAFWHAGSPNAAFRDAFCAPPSQNPAFGEVCCCPWVKPLCDGRSAACAGVLLRCWPGRVGWHDVCSLRNPQPRMLRAMFPSMFPDREQSLQRSL